MKTYSTDIKYARNKKNWKFENHAKECLSIYENFRSVLLSNSGADNIKDIKNRIVETQNMHMEAVESFNNRKLL